VGFRHRKLASPPKRSSPPISQATFSNWKAKFGGMDVSEAKRLRSLEEENAKLKRLLADAMLHNVALKNLLSKNVWSAPSVQGSGSF
jgi:putative transposase